MVRKKSTELTSAEQKVMQVLWQHGPCSVKTITAELNKQAALAYTTVQTLCRILLDKGHVQCEKQGKAFIYEAITVQQEARTQALTALLKRFFCGSPTLLAQHLLEQQQLPAELQQELQEQIDAQASHATNTEKQEH
jgi:BlaI family transcriptional regulator, penicillinase repressor